LRRRTSRNGRLSRLIQAAENAIEALFQHLHLEAWGHALTELLQNLPDQSKPAPGLVDLARELDKHYIPIRYPNGFERGAPVDYYTRKEADTAVTNAEAIVEFCRNKIG
jgi:HEPN domain-containing protein